MIVELYESALFNEISEKPRRRVLRSKRCRRYLRRRKVKAYKYSCNDILQEIYYMKQEFVKNMFEFGVPSFAIASYSPVIDQYEFRSFLEEYSISARIVTRFKIGELMDISASAFYNLFDNYNLLLFGSNDSSFIKLFKDPRWESEDFINMYPIQFVCYKSRRIGIEQFRKKILNLQSIDLDVFFWIFLKLLINRVNLLGFINANLKIFFVISSMFRRLNNGNVQSVEERHAKA